MKKRMIAIAAATMATMMMATPVLAEDYKIGICNYVDDASLNQIVDNLESRLKEIGDEKGVNFDDYQAFLNNEARYTRLIKPFPERAERLFKESEDAAKARYDHLQKLVELYK